MRSYLGALVLVVLPLGLWESSHISRPQTSGDTVVIYDSNPAHLWNRLHAALFIREDLPGSELVPDSLDPPLWFHSQYLLAKPSHERVMRVLDEFLQTHGERLIQDPVKRAILGHDLWAVFDWTVERQPSRPGKPAYDEEKRELQVRLAEVMRRLALTPEEISSLPANYAQAAASGQFAQAHDPENPDRPFLPRDLFDPRGPWVQIGASAPAHAVAFSRSGFLIFLRLPAGRAATFDYLRALWEIPQPWISRPDEPDQTVENLHLPQFPAGTEVALVRQMMLFDNRGNLESTPITESVQMRVYCTVTNQEAGASGSGSANRGNGQDFYEIRLSRPLLFARRAGGLRTVERDEREFAILNAFGPDEGTPGQIISLNKYAPVLQTCVVCHSGTGINSVNSRSRLLKPNWLNHDSPPGTYEPDHFKWWEYRPDIAWKQNRYEWGFLNGYWKASGMR